MEFTAFILFLGALLVFASIFAGLASSRVGAPLLLVFLIVGMLFGEDGPGGIVFNDMRTAYLIGSLSLAIILFDGGLRTPLNVFRATLWPALSLATLGVVLTAGITGLCAMIVLGVDEMHGLLIGAILASTDAAAVFLLLHQRGAALTRKVSAMLEVESGLNDPMAVFLTIALVELLMGRGGGVGITLHFFWQMGAGAMIGLGGGWLLARFVNQLRLATGLYPIMVFSGSVLIFSGALLIDSSGFLAVYLAGLVVGNMAIRKREFIVRFHDGLAWLSQIGMFLMIGLLVTPSGLWSQIVPACLIALGLIFAARPLAVWFCLLPFKCSWREQAFISWVGLRGAVPIFLAIIPTLVGLEHDRTIFNVAFVVVIVSLVLQGWTVFLSARVLGVTERAAEAS